MDGKGKQWWFQKSVLWNLCLNNCTYCINNVERFFFLLFSLLEGAAGFITWLKANRILKFNTFFFLFKFEYINKNSTNRVILHKTYPNRHIVKSSFSTVYRSLQQGSVYRYNNICSMRQYILLLWNKLPIINFFPLIIFVYSNAYFT